MKTIAIKSTIKHGDSWLKSASEEDKGFQEGGSFCLNHTWLVVVASMLC